MDYINKNRSFSSCMAEGYRLFQGNLKNVFLTTWKELCCSSILFAGLVTLCCYGQSVITAAFTALTFIALLVAFILFKASIFDMIDYHPYTWNIRRMAKLVIGVLFLVLCYWGIAKLIHLTKISASTISFIVGCIHFALTCIALPLLNMAFEFMIEEKPKLLDAYKNGLRHWGFLMLIAFLSGLICATLFLIVCAPLGSLLYCYFSNAIGMSGGEPNGLPSYFPFMVFFFSATTFYFIFYIQTWQTFAFAYAHGSITFKQEKE